MAAALGKMLNQALRRGMMTAAPAFSRPALSTRFVAPAMLLPQVQQRLSLSSKVSAKAPRAPEPQAEEEDDFDEFEDFDPMADKSAAVKRRVLALKEVQAKYDDINKEYQRELAQLQAKYMAKYAPVFAERKDIVTGKKDVATYEIPDDDQADKDIPEFWLTALLNHDKVGPYVTERDMEVLKHLVDIRAEVLVGEDRGFKLLFDFEDNKFFSAKTLEKTYILEPEDDVIPKQFVGCKIDWKDDSLDPTITQKKQRVKGAKGAAKGGKPAFTIEKEPCDSFFNIFDPPQIPQNPDEMDDEDLDALQEELSVDFDIGFAIKDQVIPRAVEWYTGELTSMDADGEFDEGFDGDYDDDVDDMAPRGGKNFR